MKYSKISMVFATIYLIGLFSCKKLVEIDPPKNSLVPSSVFKTNDLATAAMLGIYQQMALQGYASGGPTSISTIGAVSSDEFIGYDQNLKLIFDHQITPEISLTNEVWETIYKRIYDVNAMLEGLQTENGITSTVRAQLIGESLFIRAFNYFYLVNLYGPVPLQLSTDYRSNSKASKASLEAVYDQIIKDLKAAEVLLNDTYVSTERVRPNRSTVFALLSRVNLYKGDYEEAEKYASLIISKTSDYKLVGLDQIFLKNSLEAIWQLMPAAGNNTPAGAFLIFPLPTTVPTSVSIRPDFVQQAFEANDARKNSWIRNSVSNGVTYYYPYKYKVLSSSNVTEYTMVFRLSEQFLIRAEARSKLNNLAGAIDDLDAVRRRAGLPLIKDTNPMVSKEDFLLAIERERRVELFSEWGHRWLDLKRNNKANSVLSPIKSNWKPDFVLYPIPFSEVSRNRNITQNKGY